MRICLLILFLLNWGGEILNAQTPEQNHEKYWYYRWRLRNHFMKIGPEQGESLVMGERGLNYDYKGNVHFGDQTIYMGYYFAILALEYDQLANNNQNTDQTVKELYYALYALNRLDENAESLFRSGFDLTGEPDPQPGDLNGFFVRDDVDYEFYNLNFDHFNFDKIESQANLINLDYKISSDWMHDAAFPDSQRKDSSSAEMSMDQTLSIMMGLAMIRKFVPSGLVYMGNNNLPFQDNVYDIRQESDNIMKRIIEHCNGTSDPSYTNAWRIKNPETGTNVNRGPNMGQWSFGIAQAASINSSHDFSTTYSDLNFFSFMGLVSSGVVQATTEDNANMFNTVLLAANLSNSNNYLAYGTREMWHVPLINEVLNGAYNLTVSNSVYEDLLNSAGCEGPYMYPYTPGPVYGAWEWSTSDRILHPSKRGPIGTQGEFNGLDYMLYHNLYYATQDQDYSSPFDLVNTIVETDLPFFDGTIGVGTTYNPLNLKSFNTIVASHAMHPSGYNQLPNGHTEATYRAGYSIVLEPGFSVEPGAEFLAYVDPFECASDNTYKMNEGGSGSTYRPHNQQSIKADDYAQNMNSESVWMEDGTRINDDYITIYPNPASDFVNVNFGQRETGSLTILSADGKKLFSVGFENQIELEMSTTDLPVGLYWVKITIGGGIINKKLIKE